jgi:ATP-dependent RNA helicase RhlE
MMFTATMPSDVERIARMSMKDPVRIQVGLRSAPAAGAQQKLFAVRDDEKNPLLMKLLAERGGSTRALIFVRTKRGVDKLHRIVARRFNAARIHGDREQCDRDDAMNGFREGRYPILIATDIAARGIDVADIEHVINYDFPLSAEDYVHRIGRTARQQATGLAISFVTANDRPYLMDVRKLLGEKLPLTEELLGMLGRRSSGRHGSGRGEGRHQGSGGGPRAEGMQHGRRGGSRGGDRRPHGEAGGAARSQGHVEQQRPPRDEPGEVNGNVGGPEAVQGAEGARGPETSDKPRRRRRSGRGRGKSAGQGQPRTHEAA